MRTRTTRIGFDAVLFALFALPVCAGGLGAIYTENFDEVRAPVLPSGWVASQGVNVTGAPLWVTSVVAPHTAANDAFSTAPDNILDNRLDTPVLPITGASFGLRFSHSYDLEAGRDGAVLEISSPDINGGAFTDITDPAVHATVNPGYNTLISSGFQSPIAGRMAWSGNSGGYILTSVNFGPTIPAQAKLRFRLASDNSGASPGWRIDSFSVRITEGPSPTPSPPPSPTPTATPIPTPCDGSPNLIVDSTFEAGTPWPAWTVQTSTNFGTPLCDTAVCGTGGTTPPYAGTNWAWFGGAAGEAATLGQTVSILAGGQAMLSFEMRIGAMSFPLTDVLNVRVDGTIVQSYPEPASPEIGYSLRTIDLSAVADGGSHDILFEYVGSTTGSSSYAVDNITLTNTFGCSTPTPPPTVTPTVTPTATPTVPPTPTPTPSPTPTSSPAQPLNISTRLRVETGDRVMIGGFIITGNVPKKVAIRGVGPSLANSGLSDVLADPTLELRGSDGALLGQNDNWQDDPEQAGQLTAFGLALQSPNESGMVATAKPGAYTALMTGKNQTSGIGLVEIYDVDAPANSRLANISTRGFVQSGDNVMIGGFILGNGSGSADVVVRGIGPSLSQAGLNNVLADPTLELRDSNGALLIANDNWQDDPVSAGQLTARGLAPTNALESGIFASLPPGASTSILAGKNGGTGIGLIEVYNTSVTAAPTPTPGATPSPSPTATATSTPGGTPSPSPTATATFTPTPTPPANPLIVTSTADSGAGSLRAAIAAASDGDTIQFDPALNGQTIALTSAELFIDASITIAGPGADQLNIRRSTATGTPAFRIFHVLPGLTVRLQGLKITGGFSHESGGGVFNDQATLILSDCAVEGNYSGGSGGGGINSFGVSAVLTILDSTVDGNLNSGIDFGSGGRGGGIDSQGTLTITNSSVSGNSVNSQPPPPNITGGIGGGIVSTGPLEITNSTISGNTGGISGGGVVCAGPATIANSALFGNTSIGFGGGISQGGQLTITNSTISGNMASHKKGGFGGGICSGSDATLTITNSTLRGNSADGAGGGIELRGGTLQIANTILQAGQGVNINASSGTVISQGFNLSSDNGSGFLTATGDQINTDPLLGPLQNNGGPTFTHALLSGSPAINAGDPNFTSPHLYDQRGPGFPRVVGGRIDIGSFER